MAISTRVSAFRASLLTVFWLAPVVPLPAQDSAAAPKSLWNSEGVMRYQRTALSPNGKLLAYTLIEADDKDVRGLVYIVDSREGKEVQALNFKGHLDKASSAVAPKSAPDFSSGAGGGGMIPGMATAEIPSAVAFSPDSKTLATLSCGMMGQPETYLKLWDVQTGKMTQQFPLSVFQGQSLEYLPDGAKVVIAGANAKSTPYLKMHDVKTGKVTLDLIPDLRERLGKYFPAQGIITSFDLASDGQTLVFAIGDFFNSYVHLYDYKTRKLEYNLAQLSFHRSYSSIQLSPDGKTLAVVRQVNNPTAGGGIGSALGLNTDPNVDLKKMAIPAERAFMVDLVDRAAKKKRAQVHVTAGITAMGDVPMLFTPDSKHLITGGDAEGRIQFWNAYDGSAIGEFDTGSDPVTGLAMAGEFLVTTSETVVDVAAIIARMTPPPGSQPTQPQPQMQPQQQMRNFMPSPIRMPVMPQRGMTGGAHHGKHVVHRAPPRPPQAPPRVIQPPRPVAKSPPKPAVKPMVPVNPATTTPDTTTSAPPPAPKLPELTLRVWEFSPSSLNSLAKAIPSMSEEK